MKKKILFLLLSLTLFISQSAHSAGVTIITHGYIFYGLPRPIWLDTMQNAIYDNWLAYDDTVLNFGIISVNDINGDADGGLVATVTQDWETNLFDSTTGEIIILLDWTSVSDHMQGGVTMSCIDTLDVAEVVVPLILEEVDAVMLLAELPIHLIGHS